MNKKVCHITSAHGRYDVRIFMKQCRSLAKNGYDVTLIVNDDNNDEVIDGVKIISTRFAPKNRVERFFNSKKLILKKALEIDADIYQIHDPDLLTLGNKLKRMNRKTIFDSHEDVPDQIMEKQYIPAIFRGILSFFYKILENKSIKSYDALISVTPKVIKRFLIKNSNSYMITNYPIIDLSSNIKVNSYEYSICFAGAINEDWKHDKIIRALESIEDVKYYLAGSGEEVYLSLLKELPAWDKVDYKGRIPHTQVKKLYENSIAGMALHYSYQLAGEGSLGNTKLFEYMEAGLPVICSDYKLWKEIIDKYKCGIAINPNNIIEIAESIKYLINNPDEAKAMGKNGRRAVIEEYNWSTQEAILLNLYNKL